MGHKFQLKFKVNIFKIGLNFKLHLKKLILLFLLLTSGIQAQVLWGVDTDSIEITHNWSSKKDFNGKVLYSQEDVWDFDYVSSNDFGFLFYRENPPDYMFSEVFDYLQNLLGPPLITNDYTPELKYKMNRAAKVQSGKWKYEKEWHYGSKRIKLVWKENKLYVNCLL